MCSKYSQNWEHRGLDSLLPSDKKKILNACYKRSYLDDVHDKIQLVVSIIFAFFDFAAQTAWATAEARSQ